MESKLINTSVYFGPQVQAQHALSDNATIIARKIDRATLHQDNNAGDKCTTRTTDISYVVINSIGGKHLTKRGNPIGRSAKRETWDG